MDDDEKKFELTEGQKGAIEKMQVFLQSDEDQFMLKGAAGCGKTFVIKTLINSFGGYGKNRVLYCSPTHKALAVLRESLQSLSINRNNFSTISRLLSAKQTVVMKKNKNGDADEGEKKFLSTGVQYDDTGQLIRDEINKKLIMTFTGYTDENGDQITKSLFSIIELIKPFLIIIDECSMIKEDEYEILEVIKKYFKLKIIYVGDFCQLAPVEDNVKENKISKTFSKTKSYNTFSLTENKRTDYPDISQCYKFFRNCVFTKGDVRYDLYNLFKGNTDNVFITQDVKIFKQKMKEYFKGQDDSLVIAYSNKKVCHYNQWIRETLFPEKIDSFAIGDHVVFHEMATVSQMCSGRRDCESGMWDHWPCTRIYNNKTGIIVSMDEKEFTNKNCELMTARNKPLKYFITTIKIKKPECPILERNGEEMFAKVPLICKKDKARFNRYVLKYKNDMIKKIKEKKKNEGQKKKMWSDYFKTVQEYNVKLRLIYATTSHKSQGSSINNVFFDMTDFSYCDDFTKYRAMYTSASRAKKKLIIFTNFQNLDRGLIEGKRHDSMYKKCSGCHSKREIARFTRKNGENKKTCNSCSLSRKKRRQEKKLNKN
jgi:ATP-dependent exoDNAse (exonuclease V) alpha subunit